ncbi:S1C family serine protease [Tsukamurella soli]|uniref:S1C family serine protease n=1 Tax=Tsukamurella soli TaxID=644556 RepID=UPI00360BA7B6
MVSIEYSVGQQGDTGSGVVLTKDGLIVTNNHVISGESSAPGGTITVTFADGTTAPATVVGTDAVSDLAVIRVGRTDLTPIVVGDSSKLAVGQDVVAVGAPLGLSGTVTSGIVSALNRPVATSGKSSDQTTVIDSIQTDAAINPGNSGGALVNMNGELIGINSAIASLQGQSTGDGQASQQAGSIGLGFAIPANQVKRITQQLITGGKATHAALGVTVQIEGSTTQPGAVLSDVAANGAAARAGIPKGSVITKVNDLPIPDGIALIGAVRSFAPGAAVDITYTPPGGGSTTAKVTLDTLG